MFTPETESKREAWEAETKAKFLKELDFLSEHWLAHDSKAPFSFGGWRGEVSEAFIEIVRPLLRQRDERAGRIVERLCGSHIKDVLLCPEPLKEKRIGNNEALRLIQKEAPLAIKILRE